uniref:Pantoate--beta-alanine ligase n=1 Tax=Chromera velia CCMP2878 TaxID=1169474 RepID=A0A0G4FL23_9ALVE|eukprot:Cvel_3471.t1-p1 / transcript=Cvel_3471.t1 / gene=Cvel_3471 / organism=Chromera_velia_CCMP2878 / gene_product=3-methyl-2-oxobutanoate hydroxymethyltransferase, putative / transcript_product=3-methyl-2-oxobutanoate hydroxymethyltransferase, putative / location=Cvel_scaffold140:11014-18968(+) / protein_length=1132 / sequence_SO=supercontig / SO=protein_coding / is_pseudo=false
MSYVGGPTSSTSEGGGASSLCFGNFMSFEPQLKSLKLEDLLGRKKAGCKITMITAYDYLSGRIADAAAIDMVLVGDSLGNVVLGHSRTDKVTMEDMLHHTRAVTRGCKRAFVVGDLPFGSCCTVEKALENAHALMREGCHAVKLEGPLLAQIQAISQFVPVVAHLGLQPQTASSFASRGRTADEAITLLEDARAVEAAGASFLVLEKVAAEVAQEITSSLSIPTIGIGAGNVTDGQVLVWHDVLGLCPPGFPKIKFAKTFGGEPGWGWKAALHAVEEYAEAVTRGIFPGQPQTFYMGAAAREDFEKRRGGRLLPPACNLRGAVGGSASSPGVTPVSGQGDGSTPPCSEPWRPPSTATGRHAQAQGESAPFESVGSPSRIHGGVGLANGGGTGGVRANGGNEMLRNVANGGSAGPPVIVPNGPGGGMSLGFRRVAVVGCGSLGKLVGWSIAGVTGVKVSVVCRRQEQVDRILTRGGIECEDADGKSAGVREVTAGVASDFHSGSADLVVVAVKSFDTQGAAEIAARLCAPEGAVLSLQNGLSHVGVLRKALAKSARSAGGPCLLLGTCTAGAAPGAADGDGSGGAVDPSRVSFRGRGRFVVGLMGDGEGFQRGRGGASGPGEVAEAAASLLRSAEMDAEAVSEQEVLPALWLKVAVNAAINPLTALMGICNGGLETQPLSTVAAAIAEEVRVVARSKGVRLSEASVRSALESTIRGTARNQSSMLQDVQRGSQSEVRAICGAVAEEARRNGVAAPLCSLLCLMVEGKLKLQQQPQRQQQEQHSKSSTYDGSSPACVSHPSPSSNGLQANGHAEYVSAGAKVSHTARTTLVRDPKKLTALRKQVPPSSRVVFVPFLGGLHHGHLALVEDARRRCGEGGQVWCSVFLNRLQFQSAQDFDTYPMDLQRDVQMLEEAGVDVVFAPSSEGVYSDKDAVFPARIDFEGVESVGGEGNMRPGFFKGVGTVVGKFFAWVRPDVAIFGQKDFLQTVVVKRLAREFFIDTEIVVHETVREESGLATASRNEKLTKEERHKAAGLFASLSLVKDAVESGEVTSVSDLISLGLTALKKREMHMDYLILSDLESGRELQEDEEVCPGAALCLHAGGSVKVSKPVLLPSGTPRERVRLVDNVVIRVP